MASHQGFSVSHDSEVANFKRLQTAVLASEERRKARAENGKSRSWGFLKLRVRCFTSSLPLHECKLTRDPDERGFVSRFFHLGKASADSRR